MKLLSCLIVFPIVTIAMNPAKFTPEQIEAFKNGEQMSEQESARWVHENKNDILNLFSNLESSKQELKQQLGPQKYDILKAIWNINTVTELAQECLSKPRPFEFNRTARALITDEDVTTYLSDGPVTLTLVQFQAITIPDFAPVSVVMPPAPAPIHTPKAPSKSIFSRLKERITRK